MATTAALTTKAVSATPTQPQHTVAFAGYDRLLHASLAMATGGLSPIPATLAWVDFSLHAALSPGRTLDHLVTGARDAGGWASRLNSSCMANPAKADPRFKADAWCRHPFGAMADGFVTMEAWWDRYLTGLHGVSTQNEALVRFWTQQLLDAFAPSNVPWLNPEVIDKTRSKMGTNIAHGLATMISEATQPQKGAVPTDRLGSSLAPSKGKVVVRTPIAEVIQYDATTETVHPEPIVIVPAWIMKYYILDLNAKSSLVKYLTGQGFTVFMISWKNPDESDRDVGFEDYRRGGVVAALDAALAITGSAKAHLVGYCLGGTLATVEAATRARDDNNSIASLTLFTAQSDFTEAGPLKLFTSDDQLAALDDMMWVRGTLSGDQMAGAFRLLRSRDMIWSKAVNALLTDENGAPIDLAVWNADTTRMPFKMHSEYLHRMFHDNDLAEGRFVVEGHPIATEDIEVPVFAVGTETDHVAPWRSTYKIHRLVTGEVTYVLTSGGHNAGIVSPPEKSRRHYRIRTQHLHDHHLDPDTWVEKTASVDGSWWLAWSKWLEERSGPLGALPPVGNAGLGFEPICDAPGAYVLG
ncbi:MAG: polyhydroxyalkanoic acid synthase [Hyphomicrobiaceae bacterium]|nr:polyhydroxyalkanoic acid synthase [Hyphomicrobiaceae bacterium]